MLPEMPGFQANKQTNKQKRQDLEGGGGQEEKNSVTYE
jgi:hypothetical protein